ncbi:ankyrin [Lindgomyces ingoldianus]|uniref:Ankyrin n=1 Tax=Lindgomyces ingoldianus TaxID=673940 RepID=A0ACB6RF92_9PLEO|nr:ankyrin [Lindgomyces ingoldianus]KAF2476990.1 ankyrin [Lindgomyces ingoldianus]
MPKRSTNIPRSTAFVGTHSDMSVAGELLAGCAAAASISQLSVYILKTSLALGAFIESTRQASSELRHIRTEVILVQHTLHILKDQLSGIDNDKLLLESYHVLLHHALEEIYRTVDELHLACSGRSSSSLRRREQVKFVLKDRNAIKSIMRRLASSKDTLNTIISVIILQISSRAAAGVWNIEPKLELTRAMIEQIARPQPFTTNIAPRPIPHHHANRISTHSQNAAFKGPPKSYVLQKDTVWGRLGLIYSSSLRVGAEGDQRRSYLVGFRLPKWLSQWFSWQDISYQLRFSGIICYQKRVPLDFPFLVACKAGDLTLITQYIINDHELVNCRSSCSGKTPLLLAIESGNLDAVRSLLEAGARTDVGDDDQILPVFAALGFKGRRKSAGRQSPFIQFPPKTDAWLDTLRLLTENGASVHDIVGNRAITMLNLNRDTYHEETTLRFFYILRQECYVDFDLVSDQGPSALLMAIRSGTTACTAIDFLAKNGVNLQQIYHDGRTALHIAAEMTSNSDSLKHLYNVYGLHEVNRQDQWGWTPLHYAVGSEGLSPNAKSSNVLFLLNKGADPHILGRRVFLQRSHASSLLTTAVTPMQYANLLGNDIRRRVLDHLASNWVSEMSAEEVEEDIFFDAEEEGLLL